MRKLIFIILILITIGCSVEKRAEKYHQKGNKFSNNKKFIKAEIMFRKSLELLPAKETYYDFALFYKKLDYQCDYCKNMEMAYYYGYNDEADSNYLTCEKRDTVISVEIKEENIRKYGIVITNKCKKFIRKYYQVEKNGELVYRFFITSDDYSNSKLFPEIVESEDYIYLKTDEMPDYTGGENARIEFLKKNLKYPEKSRENGKMGIVMLTFIIDKDGGVIYPEIDISADKYMDEEALRVVKLMPKWKPGKLNGKNVKVMYRMPVKFLLT